MIGILTIIVVLLFIFMFAMAVENSKLARRLKAIENEAAARLDIIDDQISDLGASVVVMEARLDPGRNQGIRTFNHDYDGEPLSSYIPATIPDRFRRSGEMYVGNPNKVVIPPPFSREHFQYGPVVDLNKPIVPQPFADGEPYQDFDTVEAVSGHQGKDD